LAWRYAEAVRSDTLQRVSTGVLGQLGAPTADDVEALRSRLRTVAERTERLDAKLDEVLERLSRIEAALEATDGGT
jgi:hypothetical protein